MTWFPRLHNGLVVTHFLVWAMSAGEPFEWGAKGARGCARAVRLPGRVMERLESLAAAVGEVGAIRSELTRVRVQSESLAARARHIARQTDDLLPVAQHISTQAQPLAEVIPALERVEERLTARLALSTRSPPPWRGNMYRLVVLPDHRR